MFEIGWSELMVIGVLALLVVGPRDLPKLLRTVGQYMGHARRMAADFQRSMDDAAREADLGEMKEMRDVARDLRSMGRAPFQGIKPGAPARTSASTGAAASPDGVARPASAPVAASAGAAAVSAPARVNDDDGA